MSKRSGKPLLALLVLLTGCTSTWEPRTTNAPFAIQWPYAPNPAKLTFLRTLDGFSESAGAGSKLAALVTGDGQDARNEFALPVAVATGADGRIAVVDAGRRCVHLYVPATRRYVKITGSKDSPMRSPVAVAFDDRERLYVSDSSGGVLSFRPDGEWISTLAAAGGNRLLRPTGLAFSPRTRMVYVVDTMAHAIYALDENGVLALTIGGRGDKDGLFNFPTHISWKEPGELLVTDSLNFRIQVFDEKGKCLGAFGHHGDGSGDLAMPKGVAADRDGVIYVADNLFDVVQLFDRKGRFLLTLGRRGTDFGQFWMPSGLFVNGSGELYVCDTYNHRIQVFRIANDYAESKP